MRIFYFVLIVSLLSSCNVYKHLEDDEKLINQHKINFTENEDDIENVNDLKYRLKNIARPRANRKSFGLFRNRLSAYYRTQEDKEYGWYKTWLKKNIAEPPAIYDTLDVVASAKRMTNYLNDLGYWKSSINSSVKLKKHTATINYNIQLNSPYEINQTKIFSRDTIIDRLLQSTSSDQVLKKGERISSQNYQKEVERIGNLLRNNGYAAFLPSIYIDKLRGDTLGDYTLEVFLLEDSLAHTQYDIGDIHVYLDEPNTTKGYSHMDTFQHIVYHYNGDEPYLKPKLIDKKIEFRPNHLYSKQKIDDTRVLLGGISALNRINISNHVRDSTEIIDFDIHLHRNLRYGWNTDLTAGYTVITNQNRIGFSGAFGFTDRNIFRGGEVFNTQIRGGLEFDFLSDGRNGLIATDLQFNNSLKIPTFRDIYATYSALSHLPFLSGFVTEMRKKGTTNINANIKFLNFTDFYSYENHEINLGHSVIYRNTKYNITQTGLNFWNPKTTESFRETNMKNLNLLRSFEPRLLTGIIFRRFDMTYISKVSSRGSQFKFLGSIDASGHEVFLANQVYRWAVNDQEIFNIGSINGETLNFAQYFKVELDGRYSKKVGFGGSLTGRANFGLAIPYGFDDINIVPYVVQFSVGGPYSIRGWEARELGPGASNTSLIVDNPISFAQKGDVKIEFNLEYRQRFLWYLHLALFADAGNVWTLKKKDAASDEVFGSRFINQFAMGAGYGLRFDYDGLFVIRLDMGYKLRQPYNDTVSGHWIHDQIKLADPNYNFAIGYPF